MSIPCLVVLTARGTSRILEENGTQAWRLKKENAERLEYCICVQNRENGHWGAADHDHHHAFMIGRIMDVVPSPERPERYLVRFSEYAMINKPNAWPGLRNPVRYSTLDEFGIPDPPSLDWHKIRRLPLGLLRQNPVSDEEADIMALTIPDARAGLALGLGVPESSIEIIVKY